MSSEIEGFDRNRGGGLDRFVQPAWWTEAGTIDRRNETKHVLAVRQLQRETERSMAEQASLYRKRQAELEAAARSVEDAKCEVMRAYNSSQVMAREDPILRAQFGIFDDDFAAARRRKLTQWYG
jgi:hypothetical protein